MSTTEISINELFRLYQEQLGLTWLSDAHTGSHRLVLQLEKNTPCPVGHLDLIHPHPVQVIGAAEYDYLHRLGKNSYHDSLQHLCSEGSRLIILCTLTETPQDLLGMAIQNGIAVLHSTHSSDTVVSLLNEYLCSLGSKYLIQHGVFLEVLGIGVLLTGASGIGKSELALELISRGHRLIADDAPEFYRSKDEVVIGRCPPLLQDFIEVRGLGLLNIRAMFGEDAIREQKPLELLLHLSAIGDESTAQTDRLRGSRHTHEILGCAIPALYLPVAPGRNLAVLVEASARCRILYNKGYDPYDDFTARHQRLMAEEQ